jgi:peptidoglycan/xylan/chitin deacetylase (PgdA/CDA1 family)
MTSGAVERAAAEDVAAWRESPARLAALPLGAFDEAPVLEVAARRLLIALRVPVTVVSALAALSRRRSAASLAQSYRYWRGVRRALRDDDAWRRLTQGTTILMYHALAAEGEAASRFVLPRRSFERQLRWLIRRRPVLGLADLVAHRREHRLPPSGAVVLTFDDGFLDNATVAAPALAALGIPATFFIVTGRMGGRTAWNVPDELAGRRVMSWHDAAGLRDAGFELGAHTRTHPNLTRLDLASLDSELSGARSDVERELNVDAETFAYPYGAWNRTAAEGAKRAGFACACTIQPGRNGPRTPLHELRRTEIAGTDSFVRFVCGVMFGDARIVPELVRRLRRRGRPA